MKRLTVEIATLLGPRNVPGYEVPGTDGLIAVHCLYGQWGLTHVPTGMGMSSLAQSTRAECVAAAQCFYRACKRLGIDLRRRRKRLAGKEDAALRRACRKWLRQARRVG